MQVTIANAVRVAVWAVGLTAIFFCYSQALTLSYRQKGYEAHSQRLLEKTREREGEYSDPHDL